MFSEDLEEKKDKLQAHELQSKDLNIISNHEAIYPRRVI